jgi:glycosyltransferase involved in cell wall biosynthesis
MKILYVTTLSRTINAFLIPHIGMLIEEGHQVDMVAHKDEELNPELTNMGCRFFEVPFQRSPLSKKNFYAYKELKTIIEAEGYDIVHTHTPTASAIVRVICKKNKNISVFYTAHGFHFYTGAPIKNWMLYYPIEKWLAKYTDVLITINQEDFKRAKEKFNAGNVEYIRGVGIDLDKYKEFDIDKRDIKIKNNIPEDAYVLLSVGELNDNKNHKVIIEALKNICDKNIHYVICGTGIKRENLLELASNHGLEVNVHLLGHRNDIPEMCKMADVFLFPSKREGLGLAALEAMASGLPIITSNVHGIVDYSIDGVTGYTCKPTSVVDFEMAIKKCLANKENTKCMGKNNRVAVKEFEVTGVIQELKGIYDKHEKSSFAK